MAEAVARTVPLEVAALVTDHLSTLGDLESTATGTEGTAFAVAATGRIVALRKEYEHITLSRSKPWFPIDSPEHAEFTRIISIPPHRSRACASVGREAKPMVLPKLEALRIWFDEKDGLGDMGDLRRVLVCGLGVDDDDSDEEDPDAYEDDAYHGCSNYTCDWNYRFPCTTGVLRGITTGSNSFRTCWDDYPPFELPQVITSLTVVIEPSPYSTEWKRDPEDEEDEGEDCAKGVAKVCVEEQLAAVTIVFLSKGPNVSWIPESAATVDSPATWEANEHLLVEYISAAAETIVDGATAPHQIGKGEWHDRAVKRFTIANATAMLGAVARPAAEVDAALERVKAAFAAEVEKYLGWELEREARFDSLPRAKAYNIPVDDVPQMLGLLNWISMDEYLAQPGWDLALDAHEVAPWLEGK
ncbi:hypothetical protein Q8F55_009222 [Vanrija albida]|uniref:Uncharacterized protein n=1 Tax=Vanrija albida TaxID=181172 RepID=A0ABR3PT18_9TREE